MTVGVVIAAAGSGTRMGAEGNKVLLSLYGKPILQYSLECFAGLPEVEEIVVVTRECDRPVVEGLAEKAAPQKRVQVVVGGATRQESVYLGLQALSSHVEWAAIHDGARPFLTPELVRRTLDAVREHQAVGVGVPVKDTIKRVREGRVVETPPRNELWAIQTPQVFARDLILEAHRQAAKLGVEATDDCALLEELGRPVHIVAGDYRNLKITTPEDLPREERILVGLGYDVHRLVADKPLILGGVEIPHELGLLGHSDADVLTHALMDALLGAMGEGDLGELFPDTDPQYAGISSLVLLSQVVARLESRRLEIGNVDLIIQAQKPKLTPWKGKIKAKLSEVLGISADQINLKATTTEGLGFVGREEGMAAQAVVVLRGRQS